MTKHLPLGPRPAPRTRPSAAALRVLACLAGASEPLTVAELTALLGGHPNTVRLHLEPLVASGLVDEHRVPASGRGRPAKTYIASADGHQVAGADPSALELGALMAAVIEQLAGSAEPSQAAVALGRSWGRRLVATSDEGSLVGTLTRQGFAPEPTAAGLELHVCPLLTEALEHPDVVCQIHQGMIEQVGGVGHQLRPFALPGACLVVPGPAEAGH